MDELEEKAVRFDLFKRNFKFAFESLDERFKNNQEAQFLFDEDWNLLARLNGEKLFYASHKRMWVKIP